MGLNATSLVPHAASWLQYPPPPFITWDYTLIPPNFYKWWLCHLSYSLLPYNFYASVKIWHLYLYKLQPSKGMYIILVYGITIFILWQMHEIMQLYEGIAWMHRCTELFCICDMGHLYYNWITWLTPFSILAV